MQASETSATGAGLTREFVLMNQIGMHARPAAMFVRITSRYNSEVTVEKDGNCVSGKSMLGLLTLAASGGSMIKVTAVGPDAERVLEELGALIERKFDED